MNKQDPFAQPRIVQYNFGSKPRFDAEGYLVREPAWPFFVVRMPVVAMDGSKGTTDVKITLDPGRYNGDWENIPWPETIAEFRNEAARIIHTIQYTKTAARAMSLVDGFVFNVDEPLPSLPTAPPPTPDPVVVQPPKPETVHITSSDAAVIGDRAPKMA